MNYLDKIINDKEISLIKNKKKLPIDMLLASDVINGPTLDFNKAIKNKHSVIAEIKKASPSKGVISPDLDIQEIALAYESSSCNAVSVLTEEIYFKGSLDDLKTVRGLITKPVLRKDFIIDEYQIYESKYFGADAILLIAAILPPKILNAYIRLASDIFLDCLVEVHSEEDLEKAIGCEATIIGINNRDLETFDVNLQTSARLSVKIPDDIVKVSESGISSHQDIKRLSEFGIDAFLIGESILKSKDPAAFIAGLKKGD